MAVDALDGWGLPAQEALARDFAVVMSELVTNAVQHAGDATLAIGIAVQLHRDGGLSVVVDDHDPERLQMYTTAPGLRGKGCGLALVRGLLTDAGGHLSIRRHHDGSKSVGAHWPPHAIADAYLRSVPESPDAPP